MNPRRRRHRRAVRNFRKRFWRAYWSQKAYLEAHPWRVFAPGGIRSIIERYGKETP